ncbi:MAG: GTPase HflX [Planctomycetaceae bacterium]|nr:GTPase HflX [Planctomycetaceae bacterium]
MGDPKREELSVSSQKAILVGVFSPDEGFTREDALEELRGLVKTAGVEVVGEMVQMRDTPHTSHCVGTGKLEELKQLVEATDAQVVIFDNNLTPSQGRALEQALEKPIVDRSEVILDIFATHAQTHEAMLQVELAQLMYFRTRLKRMWTHLERIGGGGTGGLGAGRGPGEKQLETDRRLVDKRISELKRKLREVEQRRERTVSLRRDLPTVSLVGYTNAGKSTLMRQLTGADVLVEDKLFATLDTRTRRWSLPGFGEVLLSDTVGFVRNLPHHLVASFRSTLEEARHTDLLLHIVDASNPEAERQIHTVYQVLKEIGIECSNVLLVLNKVDRIEDQSLVDVLRRHYVDTVTISAATGAGTDRLAAVVAERLSGGFCTVSFETGSGNGKLFAWLSQHATESTRTYTDESAARVKIECQIPRPFVRVMPKNDVEQLVIDGEAVIEVAADEFEEFLRQRNAHAEAAVVSSDPLTSSGEEH